MSEPRSWRDDIQGFSHRCKLVFNSYYLSANSINELEGPLSNGPMSDLLMLSRLQSLLYVTRFRAE